MVKKLLFLVLIIAALTFVVLVLSEKGPKLDVQVKGDSFFEGLRIVNKKDGVTDWVLLAKRADMTKDGKEALLSDVEVKLQSQGMTVSAAKGLYNMETRQISVEGVLHASNDDYIFTTSRVRIDGNKGDFDTSEDVKIEGSKFELTGKGMHAENNQHKVRILKDVKATFNR
jgi:LPS export ABC transporter protein LptC